MTADPVPTSVPDANFYRSARPVRRFVAAVVVIALALVAVWWSALLAPRLSLTVAGGAFDEAAGGGMLQIALTNDAPTDLRLLGLRLGDDAVELTSLIVDGAPLEDGMTVAGGRTVAVVVAYEGPWCPVDPGGGIRVSLDVETIAGVARTARPYTWAPHSGAGRPC